MAGNPQQQVRLNTMLCQEVEKLAKLTKEVSNLKASYRKT